MGPSDASEGDELKSEARVSACGNESNKNMGGVAMAREERSIDEYTIEYPRERIICLRDFKVGAGLPRKAASNGG